MYIIHQLFRFLIFGKWNLTSTLNALLEFVWRQFLCISYKPNGYSFGNKLVYVIVGGTEEWEQLPLLTALNSTRNCERKCSFSMRHSIDSVSYCLFLIRFYTQKPTILYFEIHIFSPAIPNISIFRFSRLHFLRFKNMFPNTLPLPIHKSIHTVLYILLMHLCIHSKYPTTHRSVHTPLYTYPSLHLPIHLKLNAFRKQLYIQ